MSSGQRVTCSRDAARPAPGPQLSRAPSASAAAVFVRASLNPSSRICAQVSCGVSFRAFASNLKALKRLGAVFMCTRVAVQLHLIEYCNGHANKGIASHL